MDGLANREQRVVAGHMALGHPMQAVGGGVGPVPDVREGGGLGGEAAGFVFAFVPEDVVFGFGVPRRVEINQIRQAQIDGHAFCAVGEDFRVVPVIPVRQVFEAVAVIHRRSLHGCFSVFLRRSHSLIQIRFRVVSDRRSSRLADFVFKLLPINFGGAFGLSKSRVFPKCRCRLRNIAEG